MAICLFNRVGGITTMSFRLSDIGWKGSAKARDVWAHKDVDTITDTFTVDVPKHGVVMLILRK
jgi:alpha-galactosidase